MHNACLPLGQFSLEELRLVDAEAPEAFDALTRLALRLFNTPVALISIVEEERDRQYCTSQQGLPEPWASQCQTPLSHSFCQHVKQANAPLVVRDARRHELVQDNLAIRDLNVVAYLGVPIVDPNGAPLGALCVIQDVERDWTEADLATLQDLAICVNDEILLRASLASNAAAHERARRYNIARESISSAFMTPDLSIEERFAELLRAGCAALHVETAVIAKVDCEAARIVFSHPEMVDLDHSESQPLQGTLASQVASGQEQVFFQDLDQSTARSRRTLIGGDARRYVGAPLIYNGVLYGVLEMSGAAPRRKPWSSEELSLLSIMSMFACANLGLHGRITALQHSEEALLQYLIDNRHSAAPPKGVKGGQGARRPGISRAI